MEYCFRIKAVFDLNDQPQAVNSVGQVLYCRDSLQTTGRNVFFDLLNDLLGSNHVGKLSDDKAHLSCGDAFNLNLGASLKRATSCLIGILDAFQANDDAAFW